jgi:hypothetical protein
MGAQVSSLPVEYRNYYFVNELFSYKGDIYHVSKKWAPYMISKLIKWCAHYALHA